MTGALYTHTTRASGTILTAAIYNGDHQNHITFGDAQYHGGWSNTLAQSQLQTDPGELGSESLSSSVSDELERLRFAIKEIKQALDSSLLYWYQSPRDLAGLGRLPPWYINGLEMTVAPTSPAYIEVATGICRDSTDSINMRVSTPRNRTVTALWDSAVPTGGGVGATWVKFVPYHVFVIKTQASAFDIGFDTSLTANNILARASGTYYRRIGSLNTSTTPGTLRPLQQRNNRVILNASDVFHASHMALLPTVVPIGNAPIKVVGLPTGVRLSAHVRGFATDVARFMLHDFDQGSLSAPEFAFAAYSFASAGTLGSAQIVPHEGYFYSNVSGEIRYSQTANASGIKLALMGWEDERK